MNALFKKRRNPLIETIGQLVLLVSLVMAVVYGGRWYPTDWLWTAIIKGSAVSLLALFVLLNLKSINHLLLLLALIASVGGDVLLALPHENAFLRGLTSFLIAHIIFIVLYLKNRMLAEDVTSLRVWVAAGLWATAAIAGFVMYPSLGDMSTPVFAYSAILAAMATTAMFSKYPVKMVGTGALLFVISDTVLGAREFLNIPAVFDYVVWATYYLAQILMTLGVMLTDERPTNYGGYRFD